jgi:ICEA Protein
MTKIETILTVLNPDPITKQSPKWSLDELSTTCGFPVSTGNGSPFFRRDGKIAKEFDIGREYYKGRLINIELNGPSKGFINKEIPADIYRAALESTCVFCPTSSDLCVDHKIGRGEQPNPITVKHLQTACRHDNTVKREICNKRCLVTNKRFDARRLGLRYGWTCGGEQYNERIGCVGCYLFDPKQHIKDQFDMITNPILLEIVRIESNFETDY